MAVATITARIDSVDKALFDQFCSSVGLTSSAAINLYVKKVVREFRIPFEIEADPFYSEPNMEFMREGIRQLNAGNGVEHELIEDLE